MLLASVYHAIVIANQECSFWEINQPDCKKVIDNASSFFVSCGKQKFECGSVLSVLILKMIYSSLQWSKFVVDSQHFDHSDDDGIRVQTTLDHTRFVNIMILKRMHEKAIQ